MVLHVREHPVFRRHERDLLLDLPISFAQVALGTEVVVPTLDGDYTLKIPAGTTIRKNDGEPDSDGGRKWFRLKQDEEVNADDIASLLEEM